LIVEAAVKNALLQHGIEPKPGTQKLRSDEEHNRFLAAQVIATINRDRTYPRLHDYAFRGFSQFNEDGIIQQLIHEVECPNQSFVEIGTQDYRESNTRFLLENNYWSGVTIDADGAAEKWQRESGLTFMHNIRHISEFVSIENINSLLSTTFPEIDLLSIDIDGVDYHLLQAIEARPRILVMEFNPLFGPEKRVTVPYRQDFERQTHHCSMTCFGASLRALADSASSKGYALVETSDGPNAFFVRRDVMGRLPERSVEEVWRNWNFKETRDSSGKQVFLHSHVERLNAMADATVLDLDTGRESTVGLLYELAGR